MFAVNPGEIEREALKKDVEPDDLKVPEFIILTFNRAILEELGNICGLDEWKWKGASFSPYSSYNGRYWKGKIRDSNIGVIIPPMGASPVTGLCEELIHFGAESIFLLCASWSLGDGYLKGGEIHLPSFAIGSDGTTIHYGMDITVNAEERGFNALKKSLKNMNVNFKEGGVGTCEAIYRIDENLMQNYRDGGCLSVENGEVKSIYTLAEQYGINAGVLLQPYINLEDGWDISLMGDKYRETCGIQAGAACRAVEILM